ncbi:Major royal jelly protein [Ohtaekwangia koreensis]|uniref:Major royal jelly protein n=1 Tax=Ohtaekwangia koreensis TaxID=688867 RepID=A0A1T5JAD2_9BACT|nr:Major royal jelly protein [Ohtaekwangia koreensis]
MNTDRWLVRVLSCLIVLLIAACSEVSVKGTGDETTTVGESQVTVVANSPRQWTGVAVSQQLRTEQMRLFANYPNWSLDHSTSVVDITNPTKALPYPDANWNTWTPGMNPEEHFICVQSVFVDANDYLWVLDAANPKRDDRYSGVVKGGAKLVQIDLKTDRIANVIVFGDSVVKPNSYLNDIRIDAQREIGYITDSNEGAIIVVDLDSGKSWRLLGNNSSTKSEDLVLKIDGEEYRTADGEYPVVHADGLALSPDGLYLYWRPLTGNSLYRVETSLLIYPDFYSGKLDVEVENLGKFPPSDGMIFDKEGNLYLASIEENAIRVYDGTTTRIVARGKDFKWPDSFAVAADGSLYVSVSQLNIESPTEPYRILKFKP